MRKPDETGFRGQFLIAMPSLRDPMFSHTITYVCDHTAAGALGIIINHPLELKLGEIFRQLDLPQTSSASEQTVLSGGPVQIDRGFVLHPTGRSWESTIQISAEVSLTASRDIIVAMANDKGPDKALVALGYAGWGAGQLEEEIAANAWLTIPAESQILFDTPCEQRWTAASRHLGIDLNLIHGTAGHA
ncbi:MAG: YqgE/AlgH family protein [Cellvibrionaceae bacterium]